MIVYDANGQILGRLCSIIAKKLMKGEDIVVVNAEKAVLSGRPKATVEHYLQRVQRGDPFKGPFYPKTPDGIFRRTVRGMLPWNRLTGRKAYKKLKVFIGVPEEFAKSKLEKEKVADATRLKTKNITLGELSLAVGAKKRW